MFKTALWFFVAGVLVAITVEVIWRMLGYYTPGGYVLERIARILWPSSLLKMVLDEGKDSWTQVSLVYIISFIGNGALYAIVGLVIGIAKNLVVRPR